MAKLKIYTFPDPILAQKALPIQRVEKYHRRLADDMLETMYDAPGIGLAANQVGILERILVLDVDYDLEDGAEGEKAVITNRKPLVVINPEIVFKEGKIFFEEGCLSVPEFTAEVQRAEKIKLKYLDLDGLTQNLDADGLLSVAIQHEMDHLEGKLFVDRLSPLKKEIAKKRLRKERQERDVDESMYGPRRKKKVKGM